MFTFYGSWFTEIRNSKFQIRHTQGTFYSSAALPLVPKAFPEETLVPSGQRDSALGCGLAEHPPGVGEALPYNPSVPLAVSCES